jgi:hypothetical protein
LQNTEPKLPFSPLNTGKTLEILNVISKILAGGDFVTSALSIAERLLTAEKLRP